MAKIGMTTPIVEMDGDEMARVLWAMVKEKLLLPYIDLKTVYFDLGLPNRDATADAVTEESAHAAETYGVAVKCATITPNAARVEEYGLHGLWKSPNGTIRRILGGTVFREPVVCEGVVPYIPTWTKPVVLARHAYGDVYSAVEERAERGEKVYLVTEDGSGREKRRELVHDFKESGGVVQAMHNLDGSIRAFAHACFRYATERGLSVMFAAKDTISKTYDGVFRACFDEVYPLYAEGMAARGLGYFYTLIDDAVARIVRSEGGILWACKNYDGDVMSDMVATAYGSLGMMTSVLVSPGGAYEYEAAHGTVTRHYYRWRAGEETSTNPVATIFAWTGALKKRGELDGLNNLSAFACGLERAVRETVADGYVTGDLLPVYRRAGVAPKKCTTEQFLSAVVSRL